MNKIIVKQNISLEFDSDLFVKYAFEIPEDSTMEKHIELFATILFAMGFSADGVKERLFGEGVNEGVNIDGETDL